MGVRVSVTHCGKKHDVVSRLGGKGIVDGYKKPARHRDTQRA